MKKIKLFIFPLILSVFFVFLSGVLVVKAERDRQLAKQSGIADSYNQAYQNWINYKDEYLSQIEQIRQENQSDMEKSKKEYEELLSQQPALIAEHTKVVEDTTYVAQTNQKSSGSSSSSQTTKKIVKVSKPKSTPATSAS